MSASYLPKYKHIKQAVLRDIRSGRLSPGDKLPVRTELLKIHKTTRVTLDKALNELIDEKVLTASRRTGTFVASPDKAQKVAIIGSLPSFLQTQLLQRYNYDDMYKKLFELLKDTKMEVLSLSQALANPELLNDFDFILSNHLSKPELDKINKVLKRSDRFILLNRPFEGYNYASTDHRQAAKDLTSLFLRELPVESEVVYLDVKFRDTCQVEAVPELRKKGFIDACAEHRRFYRLVNVCLKKHFEYKECDVADISEFKELSLRKEVPTCIISPGKCFTGAIIRHINECGLSLNENIYYADFNNYNSQIDTGYDVTSVLEDFLSIAEEVAEMINFRHPTNKIIPHYIVNNPFMKKK